MRFRPIQKKSLLIESIHPLYRPENRVMLSGEHTGEEAASSRHVGHGAQVELRWKDFTSWRVIKS
jgi:hypothetical protein